MPFFKGMCIYVKERLLGNLPTYRPTQHGVLSRKRRDPSPDVSRPCPACPNLVPDWHDKAEVRKMKFRTLPHGLVSISKIR